MTFSPRSISVVSLTLFFFVSGAIISPRARASELSGFYFSTRGVLDMGTVTYQSASDSLNGWAVESSLGWRFESILKAGLFGLYENLSLQGANGIIGPLNMIGGGAMARIFFISTVFLEGSGGITQANLSTSATGNTLVANGTFYTIGPGAEVKLSDNVSFELSLRIRNVVFPQNEFQAMRNVFYSAGITAYFK